MSHPFDNLPKQLWLSSQQAARRAVLKHTDDDPFERVLAAVNMGVAAETLLMACVSSIEVSWLAEGEASKLLLKPSTNPTGRLDPGELRTIDWDAARRLMLHKDPKLGGLHPLLKSVMNTRNAAVHAAITENEDLGKSVVNLVHIVSLLHPHLDFEEGDYWGPTIEPMVTELKDKLTTAIRQSRIAKIINAQKSFEAVKHRFPGPHLDDYVETSLARPLPSYLDDPRSEFEKTEERECPACGFTGNLFFVGTYSGGGRALFDERDDEPAIEIEVAYHAVAFECPVCTLQLDGDEIDDLVDWPIFPEPLVIGPFDPRYREFHDKVFPDDEWEHFYGYQR